MRAYKFASIMLFCLLVLALFAGGVAPVLAMPLPGRIAPATTHLYLVPPSNKGLGQSFTLIGTLKNKLGQPLADHNIAFYIDGKYVGQGKTSTNGIATVNVKNEYRAGKYMVSAYYKGSHEDAASDTVSTITIEPSEVRLQSIPAVEGVLFRMDGRTFRSGADGWASIKIFKPGTYRLEVLIDQYSALDKKVEFGRWAEESYQPYRDIQIPGDNLIQVGFNIYHQVGQTFVDLAGNPITTDRITGLTLKSAQGDVFNFEDGQPRWLPSSRIARRLNGLEETKLQYSVMNVAIDGSNVVNQAQQRFYADPNDNWTIALLLYSLHVNARDALFGSPVAGKVKLEFPDGKIENYTLGSAGAVEIGSLARGIYQVEVTGVQGITSRSPVALSRNQDMTVNIITPLDMAVVGGLAAVVAMGLLLFGRPWLIPGNRRKKLAAASVEQPQSAVEPGWVSVHDN